MTREISRDEYNRSKRNQYAGTVRTLEPGTVAAWKAADPNWLGKHWQMWFQNGTIGLGPVNIV